MVAPGRAAPLFRAYISISEKNSNYEDTTIGLGNLAAGLQPCGMLQEEEIAVRRALLIDRDQRNRPSEATNLYWLGLVLATRGLVIDVLAALERALRMFAKLDKELVEEHYAQLMYAQLALWQGNFAKASVLAAHAREAVQNTSYNTDLIMAIRRQGVAALGSGDFTRADKHLFDALTRARASNLAAEELPSLIGLA